jgi:hypothetical protein
VELQKDIAAVANDLSELKGETKMITQTLARLEMSGRVGNLMNTITRQKFREALLAVAKANKSRYGLNASAFKLHVANFGFDDALADEVERELEWLTEKGFLEEATNKISLGNRLWRLPQNEARKS